MSTETEQKSNINIMSEIGKAFVLSILWVIFSLPIVTIGASSSALYYVIHKNTDSGASSLASSFWHSFKSNIKQGLSLGIITIIFVGLSAVNLYFAKVGYKDFQFPEWYLPVSFIPIAIIIFILPYLFPYLARFDDKNSAIIKNCFTIGLINIFNTFLLVVAMTAAAAAIYFFPPCLILVPALLCKYAHYVCEKPFGTILLLMDRRAHPEKYQDQDASNSDDEDSEETDEETDEEEEIEDSDEDFTSETDEINEDS